LADSYKINIAHTYRELQAGGSVAVIQIICYSQPDTSIKYVTFHMPNAFIPSMSSHHPPDGIPTLTQWWGLCGQMNPRAMLAVAYATSRASHARQVKGDDPDKKDTLALQVGGWVQG